MTHDIELHLAFDDAVERVTGALKDEQFGIISRIDLHSTFKEKIGKDTAPHTILGACNPELAFKAIGDDPRVAALLPCNVTVQSLADRQTIVRVIDARAMMENSGLPLTPALREVGEDADSRLRRVVDALRSTG